MKKTNLLFILFFLSASFLINIPAQAKLFKNAYISFDMIDNWDCKLDQSEWVCRSLDPKEAREAVIVLTAKEKGPTDSFEIYQSHMNASITTTNKAGVRLTSQVKYAAQKNRYNDQMWLDGLHQDSEVRGYFTRYLATIKEPIAILVTFSAHSSVYAKYSGLFTKTIQSLRVLLADNILRSREVKPGSGEIFGGNATNPMGETGLLDEPSAGKKGFLDQEAMIGLGILVLAILMYAGYRIYSKKS